jgi:predicted O-linked N-acetylglucosamine transferase (SPINDLY family)
MNNDPSSRPGPRVRTVTGRVATSARKAATSQTPEGGIVSVTQGQLTGQIPMVDSFAARLAQAEALLDSGDDGGAEDAIEAMESQRPSSTALRHLRAKLLFHRQQWVQAEALWDELRQLRPDDLQIVHGHAATLARLRRFKHARQALTSVVQRWPDFLLARLNLSGLLRQEFRRPSEALAVLEPALDTHASNPTLHFNLGRARQDLMDTEGALTCYQRAITLDPTHLRAFSAYPFCTHYLPHPDLDVLRGWIEDHARALKRPPKPPNHARRAPGPRLRVGLLSGDFLDHPVAYFLESALAAMHKLGVDLVAYSTEDKTDDVTQRLQRSVSTWRPVAALTERELAQRIADDRLDVLLDLAGFTNHHRLGSLMMKPAPVQIGWLGYFGTQGVAEMDGVIADPFCVPPDEQRLFSEHVLYMPHTRLCMSPPVGAPEPAPEPPLASAAGLRFACLQNLNKINVRVLAAWRRILEGSAQSTLLILGRQLSQPDVRRAFEQRLSASGIDRSRVELGQPSSRADYLAGYERIDVLLDTFPYPGGTTTAEAIWMGVPTLTLATPGMLGRQGQALLHQVGLEEWVTDSDDGYVQRALALAQDRDGTLKTLRHLRRTLRATAQHSSLFDADTFARDLEALLRRACTQGVAAIAGQQAPPLPPVTRPDTVGATTLRDKALQVAHLNALMQAGDLLSAEPVLKDLLARDPGAHALRQAYAAMLTQLGRREESETQWRTLVHEQPVEPNNLFGHAVALQALGRQDKAMTLFEQVLQLSPDFLPARLHLATLLRHHAHRPQAALALLTQDLTRRADHPDLHFGIGRAHHDLLDPEAAMAACERTMALDPSSITAFCTYAYCAHHRDTPDLEALRHWLEQHAPGLKRPPAPLARPRARSTTQALRVGLLSGDFKDHPVTYFLESVLAALKQQGLELFAYATDSTVDAATARVRAQVTHWRKVANLNDLALARRIADDQIDVLLDLAGFTNHSRLGVLLMRPAPVQLSWLGYFGSLGVPEVDGVIADPFCVPPEEQGFFTEPVLYLPETRLCMSPPLEAPEVTLEPPLANASGLRFACLQDLKKITPRVLAAWRRILDGAPLTTLWLLGRQIAEPDVRAVFEQRLVDSGIDRSRIELALPCSRNRFLARMGECDVLLDTFPYPGGTTTAEAVWMGVPTLTLATPGMLGRQGQALLNQVGLGDWVTDSDVQYVQRALALAQDREGTLNMLRQLRRSLRETARRSPLFDADRFASHFAALLRRACDDKAPRDTPAQVRRFNELVAAGQHDEAEQTLRQLLARDPRAQGLRQALAALLFHRERWNEVITLLQELVRSQPEDSTQRYRLGVAHKELGQFVAAREALETVVQRWPDQLQPRLTLAKLVQRQFQQPKQALDILTPALTTHDSSALLHSEIALMQQDLLDTEGALASYQRAIERDPSHMTSFGAYAFCSHYQSAPDLDALKRWQAQHEPALRSDRLQLSPARPRAPGAPLRIGMLSGDLRNHPVAFFLESVVAALHQSGVALVAYATDPRHDDVSQRLQAHIPGWHRVSGLSDAALARRIADDGLDVLLDLSGFTSHGRPGVLLMRPAPLQLGWLGYFGNLGLPEVDGVIGDPHCVPAGEERFFTGRVHGMPSSRLCFTAPADAPAPSMQPPLAAASGLRFACLQDLNKVNVRVLAAWKRILDGAPDATLLIQGRQLAQPEVRAVFESRLNASGIDRTRVTLGLPRPRADYLAQYGEIDVLLDTFPYPGGTTTCEAVWMGVPTLTLATPGMLGRQGQALLHQVGLDDWVAHSDDAYVERAIALAQDRQGTLATLRHLRRTLRKTARTSPLFDATRFAADFEALLRRACTEGAAGRKA